jgi:hypothetical protein
MRVERNTPWQNNIWILQNKHKTISCVSPAIPSLRLWALLRAHQIYALTLNRNILAIWISDSNTHTTPTSSSPHRDHGFHTSIQYMPLPRFDEPHPPLLVSKLGLPHMSIFRHPLPVVAFYLNIFRWGGGIRPSKWEVYWQTSTHTGATRQVMIGSQTERRIIYSPCR